MADLYENPWERRTTVRRAPPGPWNGGSLLSALSLTDSSHRIIIGVDYGTTYTGISYVDSSKTSINDIHVIRTYPGPGGADAVWKTPSRIAYRSENQESNANQFGYQVTPKMTSYSWTKLLLDSRTPATAHDDPDLQKSEGAGMLRLPRGKTATEVAADYLREVYRWTVTELEKRISPEVVRETPFEFWFTVPAIWSDAAKASTQAAARAAGFASRPGDKIFLIPEPEAAGVSVLKGLTQEGLSNQAKPGDGLLICDCGGGTVDITTYKITSVAPKLTFEELVEGAGGKCGSTYIDRQFHQWMSRKFGASFDNLKFEKKGPGSRFMKDFEGHKKDFGSSDDLDQVYEINLVMPGVSYSIVYDDDECVVKLTGRDMLSFFEPVVNKIISLLEQQMRLANQAAGNCTINRVILVGGFGDSPYLNTKVRAWCNSRGSVRLLCPEHPQAAIVRGAALRGLLDIAPIRKRCRRHYGVAYSATFREGIDPETDVKYDSWDGRKQCNSRMDWQVKKGQVIDENTHISTSVRRSYTAGDSLIRTKTLYSSSFEVPPERKTDPGVEVVGTIRHVMQQSHLAKFESSYKNGKLRYRLCYDREVILGSKEGTLQFRVTCDGEELGTASIEYAKDEAAPGGGSPASVASAMQYV
ncbi:actin-like ATPase domain-containing protein [Mytilinidion resinicola]|uniref:Actin-like ATPase domain-containing protein n=1 Tax=Mytilinidion resinicola TaxID=574789 RepID=A0A6A6YWK8_9PEZI|nr:actin-like ATPase domain-containing protein [Mytilinidion resinicola]KAF2812375.1 actin-like ATPase domain-containing protein [Mytilinidion resinicola]